jgi:hypothetical protein
MRERSRNKRQELEKSPVASAIVSLARRNRPLEEFTLKHLLAEPESLYMINRSLVGFGLSELSRADFQDGDYQHLFDLLKQSLGQDEYEAIDYLELKTPEIVEIINLPEKPAGVQSENYARSFKDRLRTILHIRRNNIEDRLREINYLQNESEEKTYTSSEANVLYMDLIEERRKIDEALVLPETGGAGRGRNVPGVYRKEMRWQKNQPCLEKNRFPGNPSAVRTSFPLMNRRLPTTPYNFICGILTSPNCLMRRMNFTLRT